MRKNILKAALAVAAIAAMTLACNKAEEPGNRPDDNGKVTIKAVMPESIPSRVEASIPASGTGMSWKWQASDKLTVIGTTTETFTIKSGASSPEAEFEGNPVEGTSFTILYPGTCATLSEAEAIDWTTQKQAGNNSPAHLQYVAALKDVDAYDEFAFTSDWAAAHGGTLKQSGIVKFEFTLPAAVPGVTRIEAAAPGGVFAVGLDFEDVVLAEGNVLTAYAGFPWVDLDIPAGVPITVTLNASDGGVWTKVITFTEAGSLKSGMVNRVQLNASNWTVAEQGTGTEEDPYIIRTLAQFKSFGDKLVEGETRWFKLVADIDLGAETSWTRLHPNADTKRFVFDGQNHTVKNLTASFSDGYPSIFGAINGTVKDLYFENCTITYAHATGGGPLGILAGWAGHSSNTAIDATVENVHAKNCKVTSQSSGNTVGGLVGRAHNAKFINCSFEGTVERTSTGASGYKYIGGLVGSDEWGGEYLTTFKKCSTSGTLTTASGNSTGGILGGSYGAAYIKMEDCSSKMNITTTGTVVGGMQGYTGGGIYTNCSFDGTITNSKATGDAFLGGILPYVFHWATVSKCHTSGEISGVGNLVGGIVGQFNPQSADTNGSSITDCYSSMKLTGKSRVGGILGGSANNNNGPEKQIARCYATGDVKGGDWVGGVIGFVRNAVVEDCAFYGTLTGTGQRDGGFMGNAGSGYLTVRRCYTGASVRTSALGAGGFIGQAQVENSVAGTHADISLTVEKCIAWGTSVVAETGTIEQWGSGAFIGSVAGGSTLTDNFRNPEMTVSYNCANTDWPLLYDQENSTPTNPLVYYNGAVEAPATCQAPYHAKPAAAGKTAAQVAADLGWSTDVWDLSGAVPTLKKAE